MPFYEYRCSACETLTEALQKISDPVLTDCPECGQSALEKLISKTSFQLKGGGWYVTDYRGDKSTDAASTASSDASPASANTETTPATSEKNATATANDSSSTTDSSSSSTAADKPKTTESN